MWRSTTFYRKHRNSKACPKTASAAPVAIAASGGRCGFTLIGTVLAIVIVGFGVTSMMAVCQACTRSTDAGRQLTQAVWLAQEVHEWTINLAFTDPDPNDIGSPPGKDPHDLTGQIDDLDDLMGQTLPICRDGQGDPISDSHGWSEAMTLTWLDPLNLTPADDGTTDLIRVQVDVKLHGKTVFTTSWLVIKAG